MLLICTFVVFFSAVLKFRRHPQIWTSSPVCLALSSCEHFVVTVNFRRWGARLHRPSRPSLRSLACRRTRSVHPRRARRFPRVCSGGYSGGLLSRFTVARSPPLGRELYQGWKALGVRRSCQGGTRKSCAACTLDATNVVFYPPTHTGLHCTRNLVTHRAGEALMEMKLRCLWCSESSCHRACNDPMAGGRPRAAACQ